MGRIAWLVCTSAVLLGLLAGSGAVAEEVCVGDECLAECREARRVCNRAASHAHQVCREACRENDASCRETCVEARRQARRICAQERLECRLTCRSDLDPTCAETCIDEYATCREREHGCLDSCAEQTRAGLRRCWALASEGADRDRVRACVRRVHAAAHDCSTACGQLHECREDLGECLEGCETEAR